MAIQIQYVLSKESNGDVKLTQNNADIFQSINASAVANTLVLKEGKVGIGTNAPTAILEVNNDGTNHGLYLHQDGVSGTNKRALYIYSNAIQTQGIVDIHMDNANSSAFVTRITNDGTGHGMYIQQNGVLAASKYGLYVYSNAVQVNSSLVLIKQNNASSTTAAFLISNTGNGIAQEINNDGTGHALYIHQDGALALTKYALYIRSNAVQSGTSLVRFHEDNASSTADTLDIYNDGAGHGVSIQQNGVLAASKYGLYVYSNAVQVNSSLVLIKQNNASSDQAVLELQQDGDSGHILFTGDPSPSSPVDGLLWFDGTDLKIRIGATTYTLDKTAV